MILNQPERGRFSARMAGKPEPDEDIRAVGTNLPHGTPVDFFMVWWYNQLNISELSDLQKTKLQRT